MHSVLFHLPWSTLTGYRKVGIFLQLETVESVQWLPAGTRLVQGKELVKGVLPMKSVSQPGQCSCTAVAGLQTLLR